MPIIKKRESYAWTVEHVLSVRAGKPELLKFDVEFKALPKKRVVEIMTGLASGKFDDEAFIGEIMVGWHDMKREDETPWEFSVAAVLELCEMYPSMTSSITNAWTQSILGAARKN